MAPTKLTLSADNQTVKIAKQLARKKKTSVSGLFKRYVENLDRLQSHDAENLGPLTRSASGMIKMPARLSEKRLIEDELLKKYKLKK